MTLHAVTEIDLGDVCAAFRSPWRRTAKGWTLLSGGARLTVFERWPGWWAWCIADERGVRYSRQLFRDRWVATAALVREVGS